jgi:uncharacterized DUF497 family protein
MRFVWNVEKSARTLKQRGFSFADASRVFDDPLRWIEHTRGKDGEERWLILGAVAFESGPRFLAVVYTEREFNGKKTIRIISARPANHKERSKIAGQNDEA